MLLKNQLDILLFLKSTANDHNTTKDKAIDSNILQVLYRKLDR